MKKNKDLQATINYLILVVAIFASLVVVNYLGVEYFTRYDLTSDKLYTVSEVTKTMLAELPDIVTVNVYFSDNLPPYLTPLENQIRDLLNEFRAYSRGKLRVDFIDPSENEELQQLLMQKGISPIQLNVMERDRSQVIAAYLGMEISYAGNSEVIPVVVNINNLEYEMAAALQKVTAEELKTVGFVVDRDGYDLYDQAQLGHFRSELERYYEISPVYLKEGNPIPDSVDTLLLIAPQNLTARDHYELDQFLMKGKSLVVVVENSRIDDSLTGEPVRHNLTGWLKNYGVEIEEGLINDVICEMANFTQPMSGGVFNITQPYTHWVKSTGESLNQENPITSKIQSLVFPWSSPLSYSEDDAALLAKSSDRSWITRNLYNVAPDPRQQPPAGGKSRPLALLLNGKFSSAFVGKEIPPVTARPGEDSEEIKQPEADQSRELISETQDDANLLVLSSARMFSRDFLLRFPHNQSFLVNAIDYITLSGDLIQIRSRQFGARPIKGEDELPASTRTYYRLIGTFLMPALVILFGIGRLIVRSCKTKC